MRILIYKAVEAVRTLIVNNFKDGRLSACRLGAVALRQRVD
jgi:hypothetical protein